MSTTSTDPRPDLTSDSALWARLLTFAARSCPQLTGSLRTMRQGGTTLKKLDTSTYALRPIINKRGWKSDEAYKAKAAELLRPHHEQLVNLLQNFAAQLNAALSSGTQGDRIRAHLDINGYCAIQSRVLDGEVVWFARDAQTAARVPQQAAVYTLDELQGLVNSPPAPDDLKRLHFAKKTFSGTIIPDKEEGVIAV